MPGILSDGEGRARRDDAFRAGFVALIVLVAPVSACADSTRAPSSPSEVSGNAARRVGRGTAARDDEHWAFRNTTASPEPSAPDDELGFCGHFDGALARVAVRLARRTARGLPDADAEELAFGLRAEGDPHPWPEAWTFASVPTNGAEARRRAERWLATLAVSGDRRCGVGRANAAGGVRVVALVVVGALADLAPVPTRARIGQWITLRATLLVDAEDAKLVVLPPRGAPRTLLLTTLHGRSVEATFSVDRPGPWLVQLVGAVAGGPRPLLEATVFVDEDPPTAPGQVQAPGETAATNARDEVDALRSMVNAARIAEGVQPLAPSAELARAAQTHAEAMRDARMLAHDVGDGTPIDRMRTSGVDPSRPGENVAHAPTVERAHRALWASPSHRGNVLDAHFSKLGIGVARDADGSVWVCEVFADSGDAGILRRGSETY